MQYLSSRNKLMLWIPIGFAHGFLSLEENSEVIYKASGNYNKQLERSIIWNDPKININWPFTKILILMNLFCQTKIKMLLY